MLLLLMLIAAASFRRRCYAMFDAAISLYHLPPPLLRALYVQYAVCYDMLLDMIFLLFTPICAMRRATLPRCLLLRALSARLARGAAR